MKRLIAVLFLTDHFTSLRFKVKMQRTVQSIILSMFTAALVIVSIGNYHLKLTHQLRRLYTNTGFVNTNKHSIKLLSLNAYQRPVFVRENWSDFKNARRRKLCRQMQHLNDTQNGGYDVIAFQELFGSMSKLQLMQCMYPLGFQYFVNGPQPRVFSSTSKPTLVDSGLMLLSKYPIVDSQLLRYSDAVSSDALSAKGAIFARIHIPFSGQMLNLFTTHTQASYESEEMDDITVITRGGQIRQLQEFMTTLLSKNNQRYADSTSILMGDLNINSNGKTQEYQSVMEILGNEWHDNYYERYGYHPVTYGTGDYVISYRPMAESNQSLDYSMINYGNIKQHWQVESVKVDEMKYYKGPSELYRDDSVPAGKDPRLHQLSDHFGISTTLKVNNMNNSRDDSRYRVGHEVLVQNALQNVPVGVRIQDWMYRVGFAFEKLMHKWRNVSLDDE